MNVDVNADKRKDTWMMGRERVDGRKENGCGGTHLEFQHLGEGDELKVSLGCKLDIVPAWTKVCVSNRGGKDQGDEWKAMTWESGGD